MRLKLALAALCVLTAAYAPAPSISNGPTTPAAKSLPPLGVMLAQDDEVRGACIHAAAGLSMCNYVTRQFCFRAMFISPAFYESMTCEEAKAQGLY